MKAKLVNESLEPQGLIFSPERAEKIVSIVDDLVDRDKSGKVDLSSAYDITFGAGGQPDEPIAGRRQFVNFLIDGDWRSEEIWLDNNMTDKQIARELFKWVKRQNNEFGDYWDSH